MKFNALQAGISAALALMAGSAIAAPITYPAADPDPMIVNNSGATATDIAMADAFINSSTASVCDSAVADIEIYTTESRFLPSVANYAIACHTRTTVTPAAAANIDVIFRKYSGGSGSGISQVASGAPLNPDNTNNRQWVDVLACRTAQPAGTAVAATADRQAYTLRVGCAPSTAKITHGGLSDVEPALLAATAAQQGNLTVNSGVAVNFAPIVSTAFYTALQSAEGIPVDVTLANNKGAAMPNLSSSIIRGILSGKITSTGALFANPATDLGAATAIPAAGGTNNIFLCRRGDSSGTQTSYAVHFLRQGCGTSGVGSPNLTFAPATTGSCTAAGCGWNSVTFGANTERVFAGTGSADVVACVDYRSGLGQYAVGVLSTETLADDANNARFRHIKVDGVVPSHENIVAGAYDFFTEDTYNTPSATSPQRTGAGGVPILSTQQDAVPKALLTALRAPGSLKAGLIDHPWGWGGTLGIATTNAVSGVPQGMLSAHAAILANPVNSQTRASAYGGAPNNCNPAYTGARTLAPIDRATF